MDKLVIPPNPNWYSQSVFYCTPDNGIIYGATSKIVYVPPPKQEKELQVKILELRKKLICFSISPNWSETKAVAVVNVDGTVLVYDFESQKVLKGHKGHGCDDISKQHPFSAIAFTTCNTLISSFNSDVIKFCLLSNTYKIFPDFSKRNSITIIKPCPNNSELVAAGTKNGLILLFDSEKMEIKARLRGHDNSITSLSFQLVLNDTAKEQAAVDDSELFNIYEFEKVENEFGVYQENTADGSDDDEDANEAAVLQEKVHNTSTFDFLEACDSLKQQIMGNKNDVANENRTGTFEENKHQYGIKNDENVSVDFSIESNPSSHTPVLTEESLNYLDECQRMKDLEPTSTVPAIDDQYKIILASGSRECVVWLWDVSECTDLHKIKWHPKAKSSLPEIFTNVLWMSSDTILITDNNGDIVEYKIKYDTKTKSVTHQVQKQVFDVKGVLNICKNIDGSVLWASSIHRHICCFETESFNKITSLDTLQIRIHYIIENPIDSHLIAIGGNDRRLCLWNTSEANHHNIKLKPFMNKIHSCILCICWHPDKDNILAFSTREGRIGILDTNKFTNVPIILERISSREIYSMAWAKFQNSNGCETTALFACGDKKFGYYNSKDYKINHLKEFKDVCSVAVHENLLALGTKLGFLQIVSMSRNFKILSQRKICSKYIGMMTWNKVKDMLAIASDSGTVLIKNLNEESAIEILEESIFKFASQKRVFSVRFNKTGEHLVTCCLNGYIKVLDIEKAQILAIININTDCYSAIFMPHNENFIICGGKDSTLHSYEWNKYPAEKNFVEKSLQFEDKIKSLDWASLAEVTTILKNNKKRTKKIAQDASALDIAEGLMNTMNLSSKKSSTLMPAANREISVNPVEYMEMILGDEPRDPSMNEMMMTGSRNDVKNMIENESKYKSNSIGGIVLPQLTDHLKDDILKRIAAKSLTEVHVAVSPSISFDLWRKCALAFGYQCIEKEEFIQAVPYLLAVNEIDSCVQRLCESKYFREAWVIARMRKDEKDSIFDTILRKWIEYYDYSGNYEAGAALYCIRKEFKKAKELLDKRQIKSENLLKVYNMISSKINDTKY